MMDNSSIVCLEYEGNSWKSSGPEWKGVLVKLGPFLCILNEEGPFHCKDLSLYNQPRGVTLNTDIMRLPIKVPSSWFMNETHPHQLMTSNWHMNVGYDGPTVLNRPQLLMRKKTG